MTRDVADEGWTAPADRTRRAIVLELAEGERTVGDTDALPISQPPVSPHLKVLQRVGMVSDRPEGAEHVCRLNERGVAPLGRHGRGWESRRDGVADDLGWPVYPARYADLRGGRA